MREKGNYGYTLILKHSPEGMAPFYTLYGHLGQSILETWKPGDSVKAGTKLGVLGTSSENGNWPPHLHFQVMLDLLEQNGDFPGVAFPEEAATWMSICPDPVWISGLRVHPDNKSSTDESLIIQTRSAKLGKGLSISYDKPLHMVRGAMQYLVDISGRRYLGPREQRRPCGPRAPPCSGCRPGANGNTEYQYPIPPRGTSRICRGVVGHFPSRIMCVPFCKLR